MSTIDLFFDGKAFPVPKKSVFELLEHRRLFEATSYTVRSSVPLRIFQSFVDSLKNQTKVSVTKGNAASLWLLAREFCLPDAEARCATFSVPVDQFWTLSDRVSELERQLSSFSNPASPIDDPFASQEEGLENLRLTLTKLQTSFERVEGQINQLNIDVKQLRAAPKPSPSPSPSPPRSVPPTQQPPPTRRSNAPGRIQIPMREVGSKDGIISYLTKAHGGSVHEKGIVPTISQSVYNDDPQFAPKNAADLASDSRFISKDEPDQWVCWDFREMRVCPTHYTLDAYSLKSWIVEGSVNGRYWTEIDRQSDNQDFKAGWGVASFDFQKEADFRFIRLTQAGKRHVGNHCLVLRGVEFFGALTLPE
jgi:hypothetical protein